MPRSRRHLGITVGLALALLTAGACGSTVSRQAQRQALNQQQGVNGGTSLSAGSSDASGATGTNGGVTASGSSATGGSSGIASASGSSGGGSTGAKVSSVGGGGTSGSGSNPPGVTDTTITIGVPYAVNGAAANAALGAPGITQGDEKADAQILIDDVNAHGGVAGRKLVPVFHAVDATSTDTADAIAQSICSDFTQDHHVFVAFVGNQATLLKCLMDAGVVVLNDDVSAADSQTFKDNPYFVMISAFNLDRIAKAEIPALVAQDYFSGWDPSLGAARPAPKAKTGVITWDDPNFVRANKGSFLTGLASAGYSPDQNDIVYITPPQRTSDDGAAEAQVANAVLKFRSDGVDHVLIFDSSAGLSLFFLESAQSQHYFPRYSVNSQNGPQALMDTGAIQKQQLVGSVGIGWFPILDISTAEDPDNGPYSNPSRQKCIKLMTDHGQSFSDANAEGVALLYCNSYWFLQRIFSNTGGQVNRPAFLAGIKATGSSFQSTITFGTRFSDTAHDGAAFVRYYAYDDACGCMHYKSGDIADQ
jgi:hypothetical protein